MGEKCKVVMKTHCDEASENVNWFEHFGKYFGNKKSQKVVLVFDSTIWYLDVYSAKNHMKYRKNFKNKDFTVHL